MEIVFGGGARDLTGPLVDGYLLRQTFVAQGTYLQSIFVLLSTYKRKNPGWIEAQITDKNGRVLSSQTIEAGHILDNKYQCFESGVNLVVGRSYEFRIKTMHCRAGQGVTGHYAEKKHDGHLFVGTRFVHHKELVCKFTYGGDNVLKRTPIILRNMLCKSRKVLSSFLNNNNDMLSVIVLNKDRHDLISKCIPAIIEAAGDMPYEIIIGDTGSTEEEVVGYYEDLPPTVRICPGLKYHFSQTNNELAGKHAKGSYLLFLNNDVFLHPDSIKRMMDYIRVYRVGAVGLRLMKERGVIDHDGQILHNDGVVVEPNHVNINKPPKMVDDKDAVVQGVTAACLLTRKDLFSRVGGFDDCYDDVYQDCDFCLKLSENGFVSVVIKDTPSIHIGSATRGVTTTGTESVNIDRKKFFKKWDSRAVICDDPNLSFVTCCNNPDLYLQMIDTLDGIDTGDVEVIPINNHDNHLTVTQALNLGAFVASGMYICYSHQDVLYSKDWRGKLMDALNSLPRRSTIGMLGFEGIADGGTPMSCKAVSVGNPQKVQTMDELCLITARRDLRFDENFKFHYYGADICMQAEKKGYENFLLGCPVTHLSGGAENILQDQESFKGEAQVFRDKWINRNIWTTTTKFINGGIDFMILPDILNER